MTSYEVNVFETAQELYDHIREYFSRPGAVKAISNETGECVYRNENGNKCAVGCCISDSLYDYLATDSFGIEGKSAEDLVEQFPILKLILNGDDAEGEKKLFLLKNAQNLHDTASTDAQDFVRLLDVFASAIGLNVINNYYKVRDNSDYSVSVTKN